MRNTKKNLNLNRNGNGNVSDGVKLTLNDDGKICQALILILII